MTAFNWVYSAVVTENGQTLRLMCYNTKTCCNRKRSNAVDSLFNVCNLTVICYKDL